MRGALNTEFKEIAPLSFSRITHVKYKDKMCVCAQYLAGAEPRYYSLDGEEIPAENVAGYLGIKDLDCSGWAEESICNALKDGIVPDQIQGEYKKNITREEFCTLAMKLACIYDVMLKDYIVSENVFSDTDSPYVAAAYKLGIVEGTGQGKFSPDNEITRQESAVMLTNLVKVIGYDRKITPKHEDFIDDSYFAAWAKDSIYFITGEIPEYTSIMIGTEQNKFSPWMTYTREQAVSTMYRIFCMLYY